MNKENEIYKSSSKNNKNLAKLKNIEILTKPKKINLVIAKKLLKKFSNTKI